MKGMRGGFDPNMIFNRYSGGQDTLDVNMWTQQSMQRDPNAKQNIDTFVAAQGITNGKVTREQFAVYIQQRMSGFTGAAPGTPPGAPGTATPGAPAAAPQVDDARIRDSFNRRDENKDGVLQPNEMSEGLRAELDKYDKNKNGVIEFEEYKEYYLAMRAQRDDNRGNDPRQQRQGGPGDEFQPPPEEEKQVVYRRLSDLPKELPQWFLQIPHRNPGQIALYEWKNANMPVADFRKYDRNADGFITVEEVLGFDKLNKNGGSGGRRGSDSQQPQEETMLVLAGPGAISEDTPLDGAFGEGGDNRMMAGMSRMGNNNGFNRGGNTRGGNTGGSTKGGPPGGFTKGGQTPGGFTKGGNTDPRSSRGGQSTDKTKGGNRTPRGE
jgi:Ca2+-binding EF-hand superfamily protein